MTTEWLHVGAEQGGAERALAAAGFTRGHQAFPAPRELKAIECENTDDRGVVEHVLRAANGKGPGIHPVTDTLICYREGT